MNSLKVETPSRTIWPISSMRASGRSVMMQWKP